MEFEFKYAYGYKMLVEFNRVHARAYLRWLDTLFRVVVLVCGLIIAVLSVSLLAFDGVTVRNVLFLLLGLLFIALVFLSNHLSALISRGMMVKGLGELEITAGGEGIFMKSLKGEERFYYSGVTKLCRSRGVYYVFIDRRHAVLLPERALVSGEAAALGAFLSEKCGLPVKEIK